MITGMDILAFLAAPFALKGRTPVDAEQFAGHVVPKNEPEVSLSKPPEFKPRWWFSSYRLDARPLAWSLENRPEDWRWGGGGYTIVHKPSNHTYWVGVGPYRLFEAMCSCHQSSRGRFQMFQQGLFHKAFKTWKAAN